MALERAAFGPTDPHVPPVATIVAIVAGVIGLVAGAIMQLGPERAITTMPNPWVTVPLAVVAAGGVVLAYVRRERYRPLAFAGLGAAVAAMILGYVIVASLVALGAVVVCAIAAKFL